MNQELLLKLPTGEWLRWLRHIRRTPGPLGADNVLVVQTWLQKTLLPQQLEQFMRDWTGKMEVAPLGETDILVIFMIKSNGQRQAVTTSLGNMQARINKKAFRNAIAQQIMQFRVQWLQNETQEKLCDHCKCELENGQVESHVDHVHVPFCDLLHRFMEQEGSTTTVEVHRGTLSNGMECWMLQDEQLRQRWQEFHQQHAQLRMLCKPCNLGVCNTARPRKTASEAAGCAERSQEPTTGCTSKAKPAKKKQKTQGDYVPPLFLPELL